MVRTMTGLLLAVALLAPAQAQAQTWGDISGTYVSSGTGRICLVEQVGNVFLFQAENGAQAYFRVTDAWNGTLMVQSHDGGWLGDTAVSVRRGPFGRNRLTFWIASNPSVRGDTWTQTY